MHTLIDIAPCWTFYGFLFAMAAYLYETLTAAPGQLGLVLAGIAALLLLPLFLLIVLFGMVPVALIAGIFLVGALVDVSAIKLAGRAHG